MSNFQRDLRVLLLFFLIENNPVRHRSHRYFLGNISVDHYREIQLLEYGEHCLRYDIIPYLNTVNIKNVHDANVHVFVKVFHALFRVYLLE